MAQQPPPPSYNNAMGYQGDPNAYKNVPGPAGYAPPPGQHGYAPPPGSGYAPPPGSGYAPPPGQPGSGYAPPPQQNPYASNAYGAYPPQPTNQVQPEPAVPKASSDYGGNFSASFSDKAVRRGFIRKVYLILFTQLMVTFGAICLFIFCEPIKQWVRDNMWFYMCAYVAFLVLYFVLVCCPSVRQKYPGNFICLGAFTLVFSYMTATISSFHNTGIVLMAAGITCAVCLAISIFAIQTKIDFTMCSGLLFVLCMVLFIFGWACMITYYAWGYNHIMDCVWGGLAALVFGLFLIYDTQQVMGGRKYELSPEEYVSGALQLYIDVVYIFIIILGFMGKSN